MAKKKANREEAVIQNSDQLLSNLDYLEGIEEGLSDTDEERVQREIRQQRMASLERSLGLDIDAFCEVRIDEDEMAAHADLYPASETGKPLHPYFVHSVLNQRGVAVGVDDEALKEAILRCNTDRQAQYDVLVARGTKPTPEVPEHLKLTVSAEPDAVTEDESGRIDHRERSPFRFVEEGQLLAEHVPARPGQFGTTVTGKQLPYSKASVPVLKPGKNTTSADGGVVAAISGRFGISQNTLYVEQVLEVKGDVDYGTGNIDFPGDVIVHGVVRDDFTIKCGGSLLCMQALDASDIYSQGNVSVRGGIIGKAESAVKAGGTVAAKFVQNCYIDAGADVRVNTEIRNSIVNANGAINLGSSSRHGTILGSKLHAQKGVSVGQLGSPSGAACEVVCGVDFQVLQKIEWIREKNTELALQLRKVREHISKSQTPQQDLLDREQRLMDAVNKLSEASRSLLLKLDKSEDATVRVSGTVYPGTYIEICHVSHIVSSSRSNVVFRLDKEKGRISVESG